MKITTESAGGMETLVIVEGDGRELRVVFDADGPSAAIWREGAPDGAGRVLELRSRSPVTPAARRVERWSRDVVATWEYVESARASTQPRSPR